MSEINQKSRRIYTMLAMCAMELCWIGIGWNTFSLYATPVISEMGCLRTEFMLCITLISLLNAVVSLLFYGWLVERVGMRKILLASALLCTLAFCILASAPNIYFMWLGAFLLGTGAAMLSTNTVNVVINEWFDADQARNVSICQACGAGAGIIASIVWGILIAKHGWRFTFYVTAVISLASTFLVFYLYRPKVKGKCCRACKPTAPGTAQYAGTSYSQMLKTKQFYFMAAGYVFIGIVAYALFSNLVLFASDAGYASHSGAIISVSLISKTLGLLLLGLITDKFGSRWAIAITMAAIIVGGTLLLDSTISLSMLYVSGILLGFATGAANVPIGASVHEAFGSTDFSKKIGTVAAFNFFGVACGPVILSSFYDTMGSFRVGIYVVIILSVSACSFMFFATCKARASKLSIGSNK